MVITKKAAAGFLLLAVIVFLTAYYSPSLDPPETGKVSTLNIEKPTVLDNRGKVVEQPKMEYRPPLITFDDPWQRAAAITLTLEIFTLICYLALKKYEAKIESAAKDFVETLRDGPAQD